MKNTSSPSSIRPYRPPAGCLAVAIDRGNAAVDVGNVFAQGRAAAARPAVRPVRARHRPAALCRRRSRAPGARPDSGSAARCSRLTSCSGLIATSTGMPNRGKQVARSRCIRRANARDLASACVIQRIRDLAGDHVGLIAVGQRDDHVGIAAPARSSTSGYEACPCTVRISSRSCSSRSTSGLRSTIVTSLASSRARLNAAVAADLAGA